MVWGKGGLLNAYLGGTIPTFDFAGGTVVHITSGVSALVCALYLGKRKGYPAEADEAAQHGAERDRRVFALGRAGSDSMRAARWRLRVWRPALLWPRISRRPRRRWDGWRAEWLHSGKPSMLGGISGCVAGLVAITPASGFRACRCRRC